MRAAQEAQVMPPMASSTWAGAAGAEVAAGVWTVMDCSLWREAGVAPRAGSFTPGGYALPPCIPPTPMRCKVHSLTPWGYKATGALSARCRSRVARGWCAVPLRALVWILD
ncbi:hypothetical protein GCM10018987_28800 [Streptomyces cremeus]